MFATILKQVLIKHVLTINETNEILQKGNSDMLLCKNKKQVMNMTVK